jgi:hypothetical protein
VEATQPVLSSTSPLSPTNTPLRDEPHDQAANPDQRQLTLLHDRIADLEARLRDLEAPATRDQPGSRPDEPAAHQGAKAAKAQKLSEADFGQWLDHALDTGDFDRDATRVTMNDMETSLAEAPGVNLADMQCSARFCRASFVSDNGKPPKIAQVFGAAPFIESGFTITEPDGGVRVYFTQPGQSFSELRGEAQESALQDIPPQ